MSGARNSARRLRVLVACEFSGIVREAFRRLGHAAVSCDLLETEIPGPHIMGDALEALAGEEWDMVIAHPPCTYLCNSGVRWLFGRGKSAGVRDEARWRDMERGAAFFRAFFENYGGKLCVENPIMHKYAAALVGEPVGVVRQLVQPWQFGHTESKGTYLWLRDLAPLAGTENVRAEMMKLPVMQRNRVHLAARTPDRWRLRSRTFPGIAEAMAAQWGGRVTRTQLSFSEPMAAHN